MQLTLRKALKLRKSLEAALAKVDLPLHVDLSVLVAANVTGPMAAVDTGASKLVERKKRLTRMSGILRDLRISVARANVEANVEADVEMLLAISADLDRRISLERAIADAKPTPGEEQVTGEMKLTHDLLMQVDRSRGYAEPARQIKVSVVSSAAQDAAKREVAELRRQRETIEDKRVAANAGRSVEIADEDATLLREEGLL